jgi:3-oxoacyl-(acyl-carrier-protein) synthase
VSDASDEIVVSGLGFVHPHGRTLAELGAALASERAPPRRIAAPPEAPRAPGAARGDPRWRRIDRLGRCVAAAALDAAADAGLAPPLAGPGAAALVGGTLLGGLEACLDVHASLVSGGPGNVSPAAFPNTAHNMAVAETAILLGVDGPVLTLASGPGAGLDAIVWAWRWLRAGRAEIAIAGGFDTWTDALEPALRALGLPPGSGLQPAEGACFLVLERAARVEARGGRARARLGGFAQGSVPAAGGAARAEGLAALLREALRRAGGAPLAVAGAGASGAAALDGEIREAYARLGADAAGAAWFPCKRVVGETFGAAGPFAVASVLASVPALPPGPVAIESLARGGAATVLVLHPCAPPPSAASRLA